MSSPAASEIDSARPLWANYPPFSNGSGSLESIDASGSDLDSDSASIISGISNTYEDPEEEALLKDQPLEALERLRTLSAQRVHCGPNEELRRVTNVFARCALQFLDIEPEDASLPASRECKKQWGDVLQLGLWDSLELVVREDTLFDENPVGRTFFTHCNHF